MYNNANNNAASSFGNSTQGSQASQGYQNNASQYQGYQRQFQPVGYVQSFYSQPASQSVSNNSAQGYNQGYNQQGITSAESYHTANYRGNQPGHDNYLRSDSSTPTQYQPSSFQNAYSTYNGSNSQNSQFGSSQVQPITYMSSQQPSITSQYGSSTQSNQQPYGQSNVSANAYHMANYRGNQQGHDAYLRSDSYTPSQQSYQSNYGAQQGTQFYGFQQQGQGQQGQQSYQQQNAQPYNQSFGSSGMGQQFGYNASH
ncbi:hypothetical protein [Paenibacillus planticolens]|uniref:Uncharacterized protein n=1 Tax=Paenibacillus planticolens TaxID=2654976 RepID=A0ABX1ZW69_9BACL|nr:hypothetical protein [Paenibacillus planticolens]NOV03305.1 hypothetical protein [Paenibacillus planticolens]